MAPKAQPYRASDGTITWYVRYRIKGRSNPVKDTFQGEDAQRMAEKFATLVDRVGGDAARATRRHSENSDRSVPTLATWFDAYQKGQASSATPGTIRDDELMANRTWMPKLGHLPLDVIERDMVVEWVTEQRAVETRNSKAARTRALKARAKDPTVVIPEPVRYAPKSIANAQRLLSTVMAAAVEKGHLVKNPAKGVALPSDAERREMAFLTHNEFAVVLESVSAHYRPLVAFLAGTGARWGEATALVWGDFDLHSTKPTVRIARAWKKGKAGVYLGSPKSAKAIRTVTLPESLARELRPLAGDSDARAFTSVEGRRVQAQHFRTRVWHPAVVRSQIGKRVRVHDLRHSHASWLIAAGVTLPVIQRRLGHESIKTTVDRYGHLEPDAHAGAAEAAEIAMSGALPQLEPPDVDPPQIAA